MFIKIMEGNTISPTLDEKYMIPPEKTSEIKQMVQRFEVDTTVEEVAVIGDIHGTTKFLDGYNHILKNNNHVEKIIVMGDHFDPYENVPFDVMVERYEEFIDCMKHDDRIVSLLGNHDLPYYDRGFLSRCRYDSSNAFKIKQNFGRNRSLFQLAYEADLDKHYLFTHAGVTKSWYEKHHELIGELTVENLNRLKTIP